MTNVTAAKMGKSDASIDKNDKLGQINCSTLKYPAFRRDIYLEASDLSRMSEEEVAIFRSRLEDLKVRGFDAPRPVQSWIQCGLSAQILKVLQKDGFNKPMPIQVSLSDAQVVQGIQSC